MIRSLQLISLFITIALLASSCSQTLYPVRANYKPIVEVDSLAQKYEMKLDLMRTHLSGMLVIRKIAHDEVRLVGMTPFGLSLFDFGLKPDEKMIVYKCIEPMRRERLLKILEQDFKTLFLPNRKVRSLEQKEDYVKYVTGRGLAKGVIRVYPQRVDISHSWLRLFVKLQKIEEVDVTEK